MVTARTLDKVIEWATYHEITGVKDSDSAKARWDEEFVKGNLFFFFFLHFFIFFSRRARDYIIIFRSFIFSATKRNNLPETLEMHRSRAGGSV